MRPVIADCTGLWRRTLLIEADGTRDTGTNVEWLQGISLFVDVRGPGEGFAGRLGQRDDIFEWTRVVDMQPPGLPDAGRMSWAGTVLVEIGVHADYTEHWQRDPGPVQPCWGLLLSTGDGATGLLVRVGERFGWAHRSASVTEVSLGVVGGTDWRITVSADPHRVGRSLRPRQTAGQVRVDDDIAWEIKESEGSVTL
ncbi:hypothetical protein ORI20_05435 [Mycobacterium sp. CVI_P3]|uniref:Uncharacterized protein n=1 Tax=Mycobacterium pinniadriaticum TaxID=2994102 RepID=A0ABT3SAE3_9MYCO|nr:hypothetical protein [Mycobacterium pinniadriaticum]MCX2929705.1 hypothetical protein [Mycobacterium pinniadriaticum]MCX2936129.1 hypothetical protein [Mycobacterium pinniadriaticum]